MKAKLEYLLETRYPFMARNKETAGQFKNTYQQFGCEIDDGWYSSAMNIRKTITVEYRLGYIKSCSEQESIFE